MRERWARAPIVTVVFPVVIYAWLLYVSSLFIVLAWSWPEEAGHVFHGIAALSASVMVANALWVALLVVQGIAWFTSPLRRGKLRFIALLAALTLVALLQWWAVLVREAAQW